MKELLSLPGDRDIANIFIFLIRSGVFEIGFLVLVRILLFYVPAQSEGNRLLGRGIGLFLSVFAAKACAIVYSSVYHPHNDLTISAVLVIATIINFALVCKAYAQKGVSP